MWGESKEDEELTAWRDWAKQLSATPENDEVSNEELREQVGQALWAAAGRLKREVWTQAPPTGMGHYWFKGWHVTGDVRFLVPVLLEVKTVQDVRLPGVSIVYRVNEFRGHWAGPVSRPGEEA